MQWITPREADSPWISTSADGYYRVAKGPPFEAFHVEALWAKPVSIATMITLELAQQACEDHSRRELAPA